MIIQKNQRKKREKINKLFILILLLCLGISYQSDAQLQLFPYSQSQKKQSETRYLARQTPLTLPFFDDFSQPFNKPDTIWIPNEGTFINNDLSLNPISYGVATFDGTDKNGNPYEFSDVVNSAIGLTDQLTSCPINLSGLLPVDSVYLSFYWQREGRGERPDEIDSLRVQFKSSDNKWVTFWSKKGGEETNAFSLVMIPVKNLIYFHDKFQFRFQAFGRRSGLYDVWHVDYVYLNKDRSFKNFFVDDITTSVTPNFFLKKYAAMPVNQYFADPEKETSDKFTTTLNNLSDPATFDFIQYNCKLEDTISKTFSTTLFNSGSFFLNGGERDYIIDAAIPANILTPGTTPLALKATFTAITGDNNTTIPPIDLRRNDTISSITILDDYYAYDDGTAEYGAGVNQRFGRVAVRFQLNEKDTLTDIKIHITKLEKDLTGQTFNLIVWKFLDNARDSILYKINVPIRYPDKRNGFISIKTIKENAGSQFDPIPVEGIFYIGWEQTTNDRMTVGWDKNTDSSTEIFFNTGNQWSNWATVGDDKGSLMIRPVFGKLDIITALPEDNKPQFKIYPNPSSGHIVIEGKIPSKIEVYDLKGSKVFEQELNTFSEKEQINLGHLNPGLYLVKSLAPKGRVFTQKLVISH